MSDWQLVKVSDVTSESKDRCGDESTFNHVYGVDRAVGLTATPKYVSTDLSRYKILEPSMFAYNPMRLNIGSIGFCKKTQQRGLVSPDYIVFKCSDRLNPDFMNYVIQGNQWKRQAEAAGVGSVRVRIYYKEVGRFHIYIPPLSEQQAIVEVLSTIDEKIELNCSINTTLESMAQSVFKSWCVDFDPVRAKAECRQPETMDAETAALFPSSFEASALGTVPSGWRIAPFCEIVQVIGGGTPKTSIPEYWDGSIPWFSVVDAPVGSDVFVVDTAKKITSFGLENSSTKLLDEGTTIITARGTVGKVALVGVPMTMNQSCYGLKGISIGSFLTYYSTRALVDILQQRTHGSVFDTITMNTLSSVHLVVPSALISDAFEKYVGSFLWQIKANLIQSRTLTSLRDALLPRLLSGEIRVKDAEQCISKVV